MVVLSSSSPTPADHQQQSGSRHRSYERVLESWNQSHDKGALSLREFVSAPCLPLYIHYEHLTELLGDAQHDRSEFGRWIFNEGAAILADVKVDSSLVDNNDWSHTAAYLFRAACFTPRPLRSILDDRHGVAVAEQVVDRAVSFCELSGTLGTVPIIIRGIVASNLRAWADSGRLDVFAFHPRSLNSDRFRGLLTNAYEREATRSARHVVDFSTPTAPLATPHALNKLFCNSTTPEDFLVQVLSQEMSLPVPELTPQLRDILLRHLGDRSRMFPGLAKSGVSSSLNNSRATLTSSVSGELEPVRDIKPGIYIDVFGTLIGHDGQPNRLLVQVIHDLMSHVPPRPVYLVSDSEAEDIIKSLAVFPSRLPPILSKLSLQGYQLEYLIDSCEPEPQGLRALTFLRPGDAISNAARLVDDDGLHFPG